MSGWREGEERAERGCRQVRAQSACAAVCSDALGETPSSSARSTHGGLVRLKVRVRVRVKVGGRVYTRS